MANKCKWCGSSRHKSKACSIQHKHQMLLDGVPLSKCGFDAILDITFGGEDIVRPAYPIAGL